MFSNMDWLQIVVMIFSQIMALGLVTLAGLQFYNLSKFENKSDAIHTCMVFGAISVLLGTVSLFFYGVGIWPVLMFLCGMGYFLTVGINISTDFKKKAHFITAIVYFVGLMFWIKFH